MNLEMVKNILYIIYAIICVAIVILTLVQKSENVAGASQAITGSSSNNNFYDKNKGRTGNSPHFSTKTSKEIPRGNGKSRIFADNWQKQKLTS